MKDINRLVIEGRLTRDIGDDDYKSYPSGQSVLYFSIACNYSKKQGDEWKEEANYFDVKAFGKQADALVKKVGKGSRVFIEGSLRQERWEAKDGSKRSAVRIYADLVKYEYKQADSSVPPATMEHEDRAASVVEEFLDDVPF